MLLSALLVANISACNYVPENEIGERVETTDLQTTDANSANLEKMQNTNNMEKPNNQSEMSASSVPRDEHNKSNNVNSSVHLFSSYAGDSAYIMKKNDLLLTETDEKLYYYIPKWGKYYLVTDDFSITCESLCGFVGEKTAWIFKYDHEESGKTNGKSSVITMRKINKETGSQEQSTILLPVSVYGNFEYMYCSMLDENNGFLFLYGYHNSKNYLASLAKTTDGGKTWTALDCDKSWPSRHWRDKIIVSHFFDENNGMIVSRASAGANASSVFITMDGGKTWNDAEIPFNNYDPDLIGADDRYLELVNFENSNGEYILTFRLKSCWESYGELVFFSSVDLLTWVYIP